MYFARKALALFVGAFALGQTAALAETADRVFTNACALHRFDAARA